MKQFNKLSKKAFVFSLILMIFMCLGFQNAGIQISAASASTLNVTGYSSLTSLKEGQAFVVRGTVSSNYTITKVTAYIATSSGTIKYTKSATPNAYSYNLSGLDSAMRFDLLTAGNYVFKVDAKDSSGASKNLLKQSFTVNSKTAVASTLGASGYGYISEMTQGQPFVVKGTVSSNYLINKVTASIVTTAGAVRYTKSATPNANSYNLSGLDSAMRFDLLEVGSYAFKVDASDSSGTYKNLINQPFIVKANSTVVTKGVSAWLSDSKEALQYYARSGFSYGTAKPNYIGTQTTNSKTNCAAYVSWCLYRNGYVSNISDTNQFAQGTAAYVYRLGWTMNTDVNNIKAGDIVYYNQKTIDATGRQNAINWIKTHSPGSAGSGMHIDICYDPASKQFLSAGDDAYITTGNIATYGSSYLNNHFVCSFRYPH